MNMLLILHRKTLIDLYSLFSLSQKKKNLVQTATHSKILAWTRGAYSPWGPKELDIATKQQQSANISSAPSHR